MLGLTKPTITLKTDTMHKNHWEIMRLSRDVAEAVRIKTEQSLIINDINYTRELSDSMELTVSPAFTPKGEYIRWAHQVLIKSPYAYFVEFGIGPSSVNIDALKDWVRGKLHVTDPKEIDTITTLVYYKILNKGIKPTWFFKRAIRAVSMRGKVVRTKLLPKKTKTQLKQHVGIFRRVRNRLFGHAPITAPHPKTISTVVSKEKPLKRATRVKPKNLGSRWNRLRKNMARERKKKIANEKRIARLKAKQKRLADRMVKAKIREEKKRARRVKALELARKRRVREIARKKRIVEKNRQMRAKSIKKRRRKT